MSDPGPSWPFCLSHFTPRDLVLQIGKIIKALDKKEYLMIIRDNFVNSHRNICRYPSFEPSRDSSVEGYNIWLQ